MPVLSLNNLCFSFGDQPLLNDVAFHLDRGERVGLLGRNGSGKSTLLRILAGELQPDDGRIHTASGITVTRLIQELPRNEHQSVAAIVRDGTTAAPHPESAELSADDWTSDQAVDRALSQLQLDGDAQFSSLSSGMQRRVLLAQALARQPDVLLLDEPTNHLDIESISWLERFLRGYAGCLIFVTHDRVFLQAVATRIMELDRGRLYDWTCDYHTFLKRRQLALDVEHKAEQAADQKLSREEAWIRQGIKARRTRNEGRVRALQKMREERRQRRQRLGNVKMVATQSQKSGQLVIEAEDVSFQYDDRPVISNLSTVIMRGDRIGVIGENGAGKTTLLKLLLGQLTPNSGHVRHGTQLNTVYFDQLRQQIDDDKTVAENVGDGQDMLNINGRRRHIYGYLQDFLFTPERARRAARHLSGGERNRLLLARLLTQPSNLMILDEPTNDLDIETLDLLEELLTEYTGTLLLISHDRAFLNNVVTSTLAFVGDGTIREFAGGYDDYLRQAAPNTADQGTAARSSKPERTRKEADTPRLSYRENKELETLPTSIGLLEQEQAKLHEELADPGFFKQPQTTVVARNQRLKQIDTELQQLYQRWEELENRRSTSS